MDIVLNGYFHAGCEQKNWFQDVLECIRCQEKMLTGVIGAVWKMHTTFSSVNVIEIN